MATNSQPQETPEYQLFREHYARLYHAIQGPLSLTTQLFTRGIIDSSLLQRVNTLGFTTFQNTTALLTAVLGKIQTDPRMFDEFLSALNEDPSMQSLVETMQSKWIHAIHFHRNLDFPKEKILTLDMAIELACTIMSNIERIYSLW